MTLAVEIFGWLCVVGGFVIFASSGEAGLGVGACGAILLGLAWAGAFQPW